jgi:hypothetical protein
VPEDHELRGRLRFGIFELDLRAGELRKHGLRVRLQEKKAHRRVFGWLKTVALLRKVRHRGTLRVDWIFTLAWAAYNLVRMRNLMGSAVLAP